MTIIFGLLSPTPVVEVKQSEWVIKEVRYAIERHKGDDLASPEIVPVMIEGPPPVAAPPELTNLHAFQRSVPGYRRFDRFLKVQKFTTPNSTTNRNIARRTIRVIVIGDPHHLKLVWKCLQPHEIQVLHRAEHTWSEIATLSGVSERMTVRHVAMLAPWIRHDYQIS